ncbi:MAG: phage tail protein [Clostridiales bacterium]|nr:phage tail protein [Clostridiales bacterium]
MKPILFAKTATTFTTNGLGRLNFIKCTVTEERNGQYILEGTIAEDELHASSLEMGSIIVAKPNQTSALQAFRVHKLIKPINGIYEIAAQHISYQLSFIPTMPFSITVASTACNSTLQALKSNAAESCPFTFWTNVTTVSSYKQTAPASIRSRLGGVEGSVLDQFGGEYEWDNYTVKLHSARGVQTPSVTLRYGKNITDLNQEEEINNVITGVCPYWMDSEGGNVVTLPEKTVDSSTASSYPFKRTIPLDLSSDWEEAPTQAQLRARAQAYVNSSGIGIPKVNIKVSFVNLADTEEYKDIAALQTVSLCDYVAVQFEKLGISTQAKVVKTVYNVLLDRYDSIEVGSLRSSLAETISDQSAEIAAVADTTREMFKSYDATVQEDIDNATAWLTSSNGYVMARKDAYGNWKELFFMDTADASTAHNVLRINKNGIGFSRAGVSGPYTQAWTLDGKLVIGGTNVPSFTVYDSSNNIIFQTSRSGTVWKSTNSSMSANGTISATSAVLASCTITNGSLTIKSGNTTIFSVSSSGITWNLPNSSMTSNGKLTASDVELEGSISCGSPLAGSRINLLNNGMIEFYMSGVYVGHIEAYRASNNRNFLYIDAENVRVVQQNEAPYDDFSGWLTLEEDNITSQYYITVRNGIIY